MSLIPDQNLCQSMRITMVSRIPSICVTLSDFAVECMVMLSHTAEPPTNLLCGDLKCFMCPMRVRQATGTHTRLQASAEGPLLHCLETSQHLSSMHNQTEQFCSWWLVPRLLPGTQGYCSQLCYRPQATSMSASHPLHWSQASAALHPESPAQSWLSSRDET